MAETDVLPECSARFNDLNTDVAILTHDVRATERVCEKLSEGIEKIQEMNGNLVRMIALHEQKHETHDRFQDSFDEDVKELHSRITTVERTLYDRIDTAKSQLVEQLQHHHDEVIRLHGIRTTTTETFDTSTLTEAKQTLKTLDRWVWMLVGAAVVIGWIVGHINFSAIGNLIK